MHRPAGRLRQRGEGRVDEDRNVPGPQAEAQPRFSTEAIARRRVGIDREDRTADQIQLMIFCLVIEIVLHEQAELVRRAGPGNQHALILGEQRAASVHATIARAVAMDPAAHAEPNAERYPGLDRKSVV